MFQNSLDFGDIHIKTFDYWWTVRKLVKEKEKEIKANDSKGVKVYDFEQDFDLEIKSLKMEKGREPTVQEFKDRFLFYKNFYRNNYYLQIDLLTPSKNEDIIKQFGKIVKERRRNSFIRGMRSNVNLEPFSNAEVKENYLRREELWRYLKIYDYKKQGLSMRDIVEKEGKDSTSSDIRSTFYQDLKRANKIIRNVELGIFPGDYQSQD
jgi:hypothetical protein